MSHDDPERADARSFPIGLLRRLVEASGAAPPANGVTTARTGEADASWQQTLERVCAANRMRARPVAWSLRDAVGFAHEAVPLASVRRGRHAADAFEWFALVGRSGPRARVVHEDGSSRWLAVGALARWIGVEDPDAPLPWAVVESRFPSAIREDHGDEHGSRAGGRTPFRRLLDLLRPDQSDLWAILLFAALIGGLTLATPIAVQQLVNSIAFGGLIQPVLVLALLLFAVLAFSAVLSAVQAYVAELIQRRIFVRVIIDVAERLPRVRASAFDRHHGPELVNRVFDVVTVQKVGSMLLLDGTALLLQTLVGLVVLSFYHPLMLGFSGLLIAGLFVVVVVMGRGAVRTAIAESRAKYAVVHWLEELARQPAAFRGADPRSYARQRADDLTTAYVGARRIHYRIVLRQLTGALGLQVVSSSALLALGGFLVVRGQLTLGQLVASELIITVTVAAIAKFGKQLESFYDLLAAMDKLSVLIDLPVERESGEELERADGPAAVEIAGLDFGFGPDLVFEGLDLRIEAGERVALCGAIGSGKSSLLDLLSGTREPSGGYLAIDGQDYRELDLESIRRATALVREDEAFTGSILENVQLGRLEFGRRDVLQALEPVDLLDEIRALPDGLDTRLSADGRPLSHSQVTRLMLARALVSRPRLLLVDRALDEFDRRTRERIGDLLFEPGAPWTLVIVSERDDLVGRCARRLQLNGQGPPGPDDRSSNVAKLAAPAARGEAR
ncbi:MAG: peptidase domain-containing ABC transporter [Myxococcota bacterium]